MQETINQIIFREVPINRITERDIIYNNGDDRCSKKKIAVALHDVVVQGIEDITLLKKYMAASDSDKRSWVVEAVKYANDNQDNKPEGSNELSLLDDLELFVVMDEGQIKENTLVWDKVNENFKWNANALKTFVGEKYYGMLPKYCCTSIYDPENPNQITWLESGGQKDSAIVNKYKHPSWREKFFVKKSSSKVKKDITLKLRSELPESAREFFHHLFPEKESREYVFNYLYHALTERNGCQNILVIHGPTGTGKTTFADEMMRALFGDSNWGAAPKNLFRSAFNKVLLDKRIIYLDEGKVTYDTYATVKLYANTHMNIERKGVDADNTSELFFSLIVSTNKIGDYYVHYDDRRSSIVETTDTKLLDIWSQDQIIEFIKDLKDEDFVGAIGDWILSRSWDDEIEVSPLTQFRGERFYKFVERHLSSWEKLVLKAVTTSGERGQEEIKINTLLMKVDNDKRFNFVLQEDTLLEFISGYRHLGKHSLGTVREVVEDGELCNVLTIGEFFYRKYESDTEDESGEDLL